MWSFINAQNTSQFNQAAYSMTAELIFWKLPFHTLSLCCVSLAKRNKTQMTLIWLIVNTEREHWARRGLLHSVTQTVCLAILSCWRFIRDDYWITMYRYGSFVIKLRVRARVVTSDFSLARVHRQRQNIGHTKGNYGSKQGMRTLQLVELKHKRKHAPYETLKMLRRITK